MKKNHGIVYANIDKGTINKNIYGHFSEHLGRGVYEGIWVGEDSSISNTNGIRNDVLKALKKLNIPVLRWPGGCFADEYHWKDGVGSRENRKRTLNTNWGEVIENNHFGTHEFMMLCEMLGAEPYISGNVGSGSVQEMSEWIEYMTFNGDSSIADWRRKNGKEEPWKLKYFGIGNENWGCGGNMTPEYYADLYNRYQTFVHSYDNNNIYRIASGPNEDDYDWTEVLMRKASDMMDGLSMHYYVHPGENGQAVNFPEDEWDAAMEKSWHMDELIQRHSTIMDKYDPEKQIGLIIDEWGAWYDVEPGTNPDFLYQQNTIRDALVAGVHFNIFHNHNDRVQMANIAQMVNVIQSMILTKKGQMVLTPTYHVFEMYKVHQDAERVALDLDIDTVEENGYTYPQVSASASKAENGTINISLCNLDKAKDIELNLDLDGIELSDVSGRILTANELNARNTFEKPENVAPAEFTGFNTERNKLAINLPSKSIIVLSIK